MLIVNWSASWRAFCTTTEFNFIILAYRYTKVYQMLNVNWSAFLEAPQLNLILLPYRYTQLEVKNKI